MLYVFGGFSIAIYTVFYLVIFGRDEIKWMFINAALGLFGIYSQIGWLLSFFGKNIGDYPVYVHAIPSRADDCNIYVGSRRAGERAMNSVSRFLTDQLKLKVNEARSNLRDLRSWMLRKLRCYLWKQWGARGYRELRKRGVSRDLAWNTSKSAHGPWRISRSPALGMAMPTRHFVEMGLPSSRT